jgi:hypothetical protein
MTRRYLWLVPLLLADAGPAVGQEIVEVRARAVQAIGLADDSLVFDHIGSMLVLPTGNLLIAEPRTGVVQVLDPATLHTDRIGRRGEGPGEFRSPWVAGLVGDSIAIWDSAVRRLTVLDARSWEVARTVHLSAVGGPAALLSSGRKVARGVSFERATQTTTEQLVVIGPDGQGVRDPIPLGAGARQFRLETGGARRVVFQPWSDHPLWSPLPNGDGFVVVERRASGTPEIRTHRYDATGALLRSTSLDYTPRRIFPTHVRDMARSISEGVKESAIRFGIPVDMRGLSMNAVARHLDVPERFPPVTHVSVAVSGELILRLHAEPDAPDVKYWLIGLDGSRRSTWLPEDFTLLFVSATDLWGTRRGPYGETYLIRYSLEPGR